MPFSRRGNSTWITAIFGLFLAFWAISGCVHTNSSKTPAAEPAAGSPGEVESEKKIASEKIAALERRNADLEQALASGKIEHERLDQDVSNLKLQILGYEALVSDLNRRADILQKRLDAAIVEVVRTKSKLRSLESKAEAASTLAEAEIAVKALKKRTDTANEVILDEISIADQLLSMSGDEFNVQNYGGALYLANQAKGQVRVVQERLDRKAETTAEEGESLFAQPLSLKVIKDDCNLREGPGLDRKVVGQLNSGEVVVGFSFKGNWVRVETQARQGGWIHQSLVGTP